MEEREINLEYLRDTAREWIKDHPAIKSVYLVTANRTDGKEAHSHYRHTLIAIVPEADDNYRDWAGDGFHYNFPEDDVRDCGLRDFSWVTFASLDEAWEYVDENIRDNLQKGARATREDLTGDVKSREENQSLSLRENEPQEEQERTSNNQRHVRRHNITPRYYSEQDIVNNTDARWYTGQWIVKEFRLQGFELLDYMKNGLQAYTDTGKKVVDSDSLPRGRGQSLEEVEANQKAKQNAHTLGSPGEYSRRRSDDEVKATARRIWNDQRLEILHPPKDCLLMSFTLPNSDVEAQNVISKALGFLFKADDILKFLPSNDMETESSLPMSMYDTATMEPQIFHPAWQKEKAEWARSTGYIAQLYLIYILAVDEQYRQDVITCLWQEFQLYIRGPKTPDVSTRNARAGTWHALFVRWTSGKVAGIHGGVDQSIPRLDSYSRDEESGEFYIDSIHGNYHKLSEVQEYFMRILKIPLPILLFPPDGKVKEEIPGGRKEDRESRTRKLNFFTREDGGYWHIGFDGQTARIKHIAGLLYIANLLEKPGRSISCNELYQAASGRAPGNPMSESAAINDGLNIGSNTQAVSDPMARSALLKQYRELCAAIDNAEDNPEGTMIQQESQKKLDELMPYLKERTFTDPEAKKAQSNVSKRLNTAYETVRKAKNMESLAKHLRANIKPDGAYGYSYSGALTWEITL